MLQPRNLGADKLFKYKIGLAVIGVFTIGITVAALVLAGGAKQDTETEKAANRVATKLDAYIMKNYRIPDKLSDTGAASKDTKNITYKKLSESQYEFCVIYKTASSGYTNPVDQVVSRGMYDSYGGSSSYGSDGTESSYLYISTTHKKGPNCQKIMPYGVSEDYQFDDSPLDISDYQFDESSTPSVISDPKEAAMASAEQDTVCYISGYASHYSAEVQKVETADGGPVVPTTTQDIILTLRPHEKAPDLQLTLKKGDVNVFDRDCTGQTISSFKKGDHVTVFFDNGDSYMLDAVVNFSRSSY
jgi:hypothetical protein